MSKYTVSMSVKQASVDSSLREIKSLKYSIEAADHEHPSIAEHSVDVRKGHFAFQA